MKFVHRGLATLCIAIIFAWALPRTAQALALRQAPSRPDVGAAVDQSDPFNASADGQAEPLDRSSGLSWTSELIARESPDQWDSDLALESNGDPHIAYVFRPESSSFRYATYAVRSGDIWTTERVSTQDYYVVEGTSIAVDKFDIPHIVYMVSADGIMTVTHSSRLGDQWQHAVVDTEPALGNWRTFASKLLADSAGNLHLVYTIWNDTDARWELRYATYSAMFAWQSSILAISEKTPFFTVALDSTDRLHLAYSTSDTDRYWYWYTAFSHVEESISAPLTQINAYESVAPQLSLALSPEDEPTIAFRENYQASVYCNPSSNLRLLQQRNGDWADEFMNRKAHLAVSLGIDSENNVHILSIVGYGCTYDKTAQLEYFYQDLGVWVGEDIATKTYEVSPMLRDKDGKFHTTARSASSRSSLIKYIIQTQDPNPVIVGRITDLNGQPVPGVTITHPQGTVKTDAEGEYVIESLPTGMHQLTPERDEFTFDPTGVLTAVEQGVTRQANFTAFPVPTLSPEDNGKDPLLFVHGMQIFSLPGYTCKDEPVFLEEGVKSTLDELPLWFTDSHNVYLAHLSSSPLYTASLEDNADCLHAQVSWLYAKYGKPITIVAHSMGGVVTRLCLSDPDCGSKVNAVITLGSPHAGVSAADYIRFMARLAAIYGNQGALAADFVVCHQSQVGICQLSTSSMHVINKSHPLPGDIDYTFIGGDWFKPGLSAWLGVMLNIFDGPSDGLVGSHSAVAWSYPGATPLLNEQTAMPPVRYWTREVHSPLYKNVFGIGAYTGLRESSGPSLAYDCITYRLGPQDSPPPSECREAHSTVSAANMSGATQIGPYFDGALAPQESLSRTVAIDTVTGSALTVAWIGDPLDYRLVRPDGVEVNPAYVAAHPEEVKLQLLPGTADVPTMASYVFTDTVPGAWTVQLQNVGQEPEVTAYLFYAALDTERAMTLELSDTAFNPGDTVGMTVTLANGPAGIPGATVIAGVERADGGVDTLTLEHIEGGTYRSSYMLPQATGSTLINVTAVGTDGEVPFTRQLSEIIMVAPLQTYTLSVSTVGNGAVQVEPSKDVYTEGEVVSLTAQPAPGWQFIGWQGIPGDSLMTTVILTTDTSITALFAEIPEPTDRSVYLPMIRQK